jgi:hypothetical protein
VRFVIASALIIVSGALAALAVRDASATYGAAASVLTLLAIIVIARGRRRAVAARAEIPHDISASYEAFVAPYTDASAVDGDTTGDDRCVAAAAGDTDPVSDISGSDASVTAAADITDADPIPSVRTPFSVQPAVVLMSLYDAIVERFETRSAHLWLEDGSTSTLRLVAAFGPRVPGSDPVPFADAILGACARTRTAVFAESDAGAEDGAGSGAWRYAVPIGTPEVRGVAAVDIVVADPTTAAVVLNEVSSVLRGSLTAALAVYVARSEMDTAVLLLRAAQDFASGLPGSEVLTSALERAMEFAGASTGSIMVPEGEDGPLRIVASRGLPDSVVATTSVKHGEGVAGTVYATSSPLLVEDLPGRPGLRRHGVLSAVSVPIADSDGSFGVMNVGLRAFPARLTDAYVRALGVLGAQAATAMRSATAAERSWDLYLENLQALAVALESDDPYRRGASQRTARLAIALGEELGLSGEDLVSLRMAAILHDVGMGLATGSVGSTDRPLSTVDRGLVRAHPKVASDVLEQVPSLERLVPVVRHHHERFDGDGYDSGLAGASIPLGSRILSVVDAFVAMTSARPYRDALAVEAALEELDAGAGAQFDPYVVEAFGTLLARCPDLAEVG